MLPQKGKVVRPVPGKEKIVHEQQKKVTAETLRIPQQKLRFTLESRPHYVTRSDSRAKVNLPFCNSCV